MLHPLDPKLAPYLSKVGRPNPSKYASLMGDLKVRHEKNPSTEKTHLTTNSNRTEKISKIKEFPAGQLPTCTVSNKVA